ncbi:uncharacterized protein LOC102439523 [Myotis lucifugus]|uniref:uncharacterized protein LOC102439523 n=1 Tax=Myotis lucifugus TaxID=59463 RepID=UPI000CCC37CB|nr:uncharacterized protein LOC102439523 [Myotis lucifugus]
MAAELSDWLFPSRLSASWPFSAFLRFPLGGRGRLSSLSPQCLQLLGSLSKFLRENLIGSAYRILAQPPDWLLLGQSQAEPKPGDLIEIFRPGYAHWAVYVGDGYVVHLGPPGEIGGAGSASLMSALTDKAIVKKELLYFVAGKHTYRVNNKHDQKYPPLPPSDIVRRAEEKVGQEILYKVTSDNCEHFVNELRYGVSRSDQVTGAVVAGGVMAGSMMLRMALCYLPGLSVGLGLGLAVSAFIGSLKDTGEQAGSTERSRNHPSSSRGSHWAATPRMASTSGPPPFRLETYGGWEDGADVHTGQQGLGDVLPPMESPYVPEDQNFSPQIRVNLNYQKAAGARKRRRRRKYRKTSVAASCTLPTGDPASGN